MPIHVDDSGVDVEFGVGDVGFRIGKENNYPGSNRYYPVILVTMNRLNAAYGAGAKIGDNQKEACEKFLKETAPVVLAFPANDPTSLDVLIKALQEARSRYTRYFAVTHKDFNFDYLPSGWSAWNSYEAAKKCMDDINLINNNSTENKDLKIVEALGVHSDFAGPAQNGFTFVLENKKVPVSYPFNI